MKGDSPAIDISMRVLLSTYRFSIHRSQFDLYSRDSILYIGGKNRNILEIVKRLTADHHERKEKIVLRRMK